MSLYEMTDYKTALKELTNSRRAQFGGRFTFEKMAQACGVQKTYLSKVLNSSGQLNPDQLYAACEFLKLQETETDYLLLLRDWELATHVQRKKNLKTQLDQQRKQSLKTEAAIGKKAEPALQDFAWEYYTDVDLRLVHLFLTIPQFSKEPSTICQKIGISQTRLDQIILKLQNWKLVIFKNGSYIAHEPQNHLSDDSSVYPSFALLNRVKTIEKVRKIEIGEGNDYFFSVVFSAGEGFQTKFRKRLLELLKETQTLVAKEPSQQVYQFNLDFFKWS